MVHAGRTNGTAYEQDLCALCNFAAWKSRLLQAAGALRTTQHHHSVIHNGFKAARAPRPEVECIGESACEQQLLGVERDPDCPGSRRSGGSKRYPHALLADE
jgi:hypothetical protein